MIQVFAVHFSSWKFSSNSIHWLSFSSANNSQLIRIDLYFEYNVVAGIKPPDFLIKQNSGGLKKQSNFFSKVEKNNNNSVNLKLQNFE